MKLFRYRRPSWKTILGVTKAKKRLKKDLGITAVLKPFRAWTNAKRRFKRKIGYESPAGRLVRDGLPTPGGCCLMCLVAAAVSIAAIRALAAPPVPAGWKLVWHDEFDGPAIDKTKWDFDHGNGFQNAAKQYVAGWGNDELEFYTDRQQNVFIKDGVLHIRAIRESYEGFQFTSARLNTRKADGGPLFNHRYGRYEFRASLPTGRGVWPAIWMRPQTEKYGPWAASGEIDILEARGQTPGIVQGTLHYGSPWPANQWSLKEYQLPEHGTIADFHVYAVEWEPGEIRWYVDDKLYQTQNFWWSSSERKDGRGVLPSDESQLNAWPAPFDSPFFITINLAVGGRFLGNPDATTKFPAEMLVDYIRVYDKPAGYGPVKPRGPGKFPFSK